jgi:hypothetical protein
MRWGVYARDGFEGAAAFRQGLFELGNHAAERSVSDYTSAASCMEPFDAVAVFGLQWRGMNVLRDYTDRGVPVFVIDYGYVRRTNHAHDWRTGHWQVSLGGLNRIPRFSCNPDRFEALGIEVAKERGGDPNGYVLLCVQTTGDASHGMDEKALQRWCEAQRARWPALLIRPHPLQEHLDYGLPVCPAKTLDEALGGARLVVTGNSNTGHDALIAGVPVVDTVPGAAWADLAGEELPSYERRLDHFHRSAYGQWTWQEFRSGLPQRFVIDNLMETP